MIAEYLQQADMLAERKLRQRWDSGLYRVAVHGRSMAYGYALAQDALALCGSPLVKYSGRKWSAASIEFLLLFADAS